MKRFINWYNRTDRDGLSAAILGAAMVVAAAVLVR